MSGETMVMTLPIGWLRMHDIRQGDILEVFTGEGELLVRVPSSAAVGRVKMEETYT